MTSFLTKAWGLLAVATLASFGVQADAHNSGAPVAIAADVALGMEAYGGPLDGNCCGECDTCYGYAYNPPVFFEDCCGWSADIEFLYWKPCQEGISYGAVSSLSNVTPDSPTALDFAGSYTSNFKYPKFDWDSGFRVGLGYRTPCDCWEIKLLFTHYRTDASNQSTGNFTDFDTTSAVTGTVFSPAYTALSNSLSIPEEYEHFKVDALWKVHLNQLDLEFAREYLPGRCVTVRPFSGIRALFVEQKYTITTESTGTAATTPLPEPSSLKEYVKMDNDFKGVGLKGGLDTSYGLGCGLAFYGRVEGALIYGEFDVTQRDEATIQGNLTTTATETDRFNYNLKDDLDCLLAQGDIAFGLRWRQMINCDRNAFTLKLGWEHHVLFGYNKYRPITSPQFSSLADNSPSGNLSFYGITFAASIEF